MLPLPRVDDLGRRGEVHRVLSRSFVSESLFMGRRRRQPSRAHRVDGSWSFDRRSGGPRAACFGRRRARLGSPLSGQSDGPRAAPFARRHASLGGPLRGQSYAPRAACFGRGRTRPVRGGLPDRLDHLPRTLRVHQPRGRRRWTMGRNRHR